MFLRLISQLRCGLDRKFQILTLGLLVSGGGVSAATVTISDDSGQTGPLELQSGDYVRLTAMSNGNLYLDMKGFSVTVSDGSDGTDTGSGGTDTGSGGTDTGSGGTDTGSGGTDTGSGGGTDTGSGSGSEVPTEGYCAGYDPTLADCTADQNFDPWIAGTGENPYFIRNRLTEVFPFTLPARSEALSTRYGYLQLTTGERKRDAVSEDIFHMWFSETPNGPVLKGTKCEWYGTQAKTYFYWTQDSTLANQMCDLGQSSRLLYVNFETRCYEDLYSGTCNADDLRKSSAKYQFDVSRRLRSY
ncbi:MAG: hypothetical protein O2981_02245 [Proteobacteria bacterium]|nr:hypothetical protein [Pseudomonadota bacterium]